jgi:hypothetical protein
VQGRLVELLETKVDLSAILVDHVARGHDQLIKLRYAVVVFSSFIYAMATLAFLVALRAVVLNVALKIFPCHLLLLTNIASDGLKRASSEMRFKLIGREWHHLTMVGAVHRSLCATLSNMTD